MTKRILYIILLCVVILKTPYHKYLVMHDWRFVDLQSRGIDIEKFRLICIRRLVHVHLLNTNITLPLFGHNEQLFKCKEK